MHSARIQGRVTSPKAAANESKYPNIVELAVGGDGLDVTLGRRIINFHKSRHIQPHHGHTIFKQRQMFYRWCFSDLATAQDFIKQFGGEFFDADQSPDCDPVVGL
jgi:hypothetical protein